MVDTDNIEVDIMLKKNIIAFFSFLLLLSIFSVASLATVTCSGCTTTSCSCSVSECASGLADIFSSDCSESPIQSYTFTQSAFQWTPTAAGTYYLKALCNDGVTQSACTPVTVSGQQDTTSPTYSDGSTNSTLAGNATQFNLTMNDNVALQSSGKYIFGFDNCTGKFVNDSAVGFTSTPQTISVVKVVNSTVGCTIRWFFNFTDNAGNKNESLVRNPFSFVTTSTGITCQNLYWFDNSNRVCGYKQFCGLYMYQGLQTFTTLQDCQNALTTPTTQPGGGGNQGGTTNLPPSITLTNPQDKSSINTPFTITFAVSDDVGIDKNSLAYELKNDNLKYKTGLIKITSNFYTGKCQNANEVCNVVIPNLDLQLGTNYYLSVYATDTAAQPKQKNVTITFNIIGFTTSTTTTTTTFHVTSTTQPQIGGTNYPLVIFVVLVLIALLVAVAYYFAMKHRPVRTFEEVYKKWGRKRLATQ